MQLYRRKPYEHGCTLPCDPAHEQGCCSEAVVYTMHELFSFGSMQQLCTALPDDPAAIGQLDPDTALSRTTWAAALAGVGACCHAIDCIMHKKVCFFSHHCKPPIGLTYSSKLEPLRFPLGEGIIL